MSQRHHTITEIVDTVYCEQKAVFDKTIGDARPADVLAKARQGTFEHLRFEVEGRTQAVIDKRCFIASRVFGVDAPETVFLRAWRDAVLQRSFAGRAFVRVYYAASPGVVGVLDSLPGLARFARAFLVLLVRCVARFWSSSSSPSPAHLASIAPASNFPDVGVKS